MASVSWHAASFTTSDTLTLHALEIRGKPQGCAVVYVHGKCGNNYENASFEEFAKGAAASGHEFLAFNNRGSGCIVEGYSEQRLVYLGGSLERFDDSRLDIDAAVAHVRRASDRVVLMGHSHGCEKAHHDVRSGGHVDGLAFLSPSDSYRLQTEWLAGAEAIDEQLARLREMKPSIGLELVGLGEFGIRAGAVEYPIPVSRETLIDWLQCDGIRLFHPGAIDRESPRRPDLLLPRRQ